jgi:thiol-disulfide isomerase/thioredoxin
MNTTRLLGGLLALLLVAAPAQAQMTPDEVEGLLNDAFEHMTEANQLLRTDREKGIARYDEACAIYEQALAGLSGMGLAKEQSGPIAQIIHYNTACARSLQGLPKQAIAALGRAFDAGWDDLAHMAKDGDLDPIRKSAEYRALVASKVGNLEKKAAAEARALVAGGAKFDYALPRLKSLGDGTLLSLDDLQGKVVLVNYWGSWCGPCKTEIPLLVELKKEFGDRLAIVGLAWEHGEAGDATVAKVRAAAKDLGVTYPLALVVDPALLRQVPEFRAFPTTLLVDKGGKVRARLEGTRTLATLRALVKELDSEMGIVTPKAPKPPVKGGDEWFK